MALETVSELASRFGVHSTMIRQWKRAVLEGASGVFERGSRKAPEVDEEQVKDLNVPLTGNTCLLFERGIKLLFWDGQWERIHHLPAHANISAHATRLFINGGEKTYHCDGAKVGQFGVFASERAALKQQARSKAHWPSGPFSGDHFPLAARRARLG